MALSKEKIIEALTEAGVAHDPDDTVKNLKALLETVEGDHSEETVPDTREGRWAAFLANARTNNPERHDAQAANGEFDKIPDSFL